MKIPLTGQGQRTQGTPAPGTSSPQDVERRRREWCSALARELQPGWLRFEAPPTPAADAGSAVARELHRTSGDETDPCVGAPASATLAAGAATAPGDAGGSATERRLDPSSDAPRAAGVERSGVARPAPAAPRRLPGMAAAGSSWGTSPGGGCFIMSAPPAAFPPTVGEGGLELAPARTSQQAPQGPMAAGARAETTGEPRPASSPLAPPVLVTPLVALEPLEDLAVQATSSEVLGAQTTASREPIRCHVEWTSEGVRVWLGVDENSTYPVASLLTALVAELQRWAAARGARVLGVFCNGQEIAPAALEPRQHDGRAPEFPTPDRKEAP